jgi:hypothetical protein
MRSHTCIVSSAITAGPVFRPIAKGERIQGARLTDRSIAAIVKAHAARVGLDPAAFAGTRYGRVS